MARGGWLGLAVVLLLALLMMVVSLTLLLFFFLSFFLPLPFFSFLITYFSMFSLRFVFFLFFSFFLLFLPLQYGVDPSQIHYVESGANFREEYLKMIAARKTCMVLGEGEYRVKKGDTMYGKGKYFLLDKPTKISGQGRGMTRLVGFGLKIEGN